MSLKSSTSDTFYSAAGKLGIPMRALEDAWFSRQDRGPKRAAPGLTLYHFQVSPYAARVRWAIREMNLDLPEKDVLLDSEAYRELMAGGKRDQVPCLKIESAEGVRWMYESADIIAYLRKRFTTPAV